MDLKKGMRVRLLSHEGIEEDLVAIQLVGMTGIVTDICQGTIAKAWVKIDKREIQIAWPAKFLEKILK